MRESFAWDIWYGWIAAACILLGLLFVSECQPREAHAGWYLDAGAGVSLFVPTVDDGTWYQRGLPHEWDATAFTYKVGLGYWFTEQFAVQASYLNMGQVGVFARTTLDDNYYDPMTHKCVKNCDALGTFKVQDRMQGGELTASYAVPIGPVHPYMKFGGAVMLHQLTSVNVDSANIVTQHFHGTIPMIVLGGGVEYRPWNLYAETSWYHGLGGDDSGCLSTTCGWPISKQVLVTVFGVRIPLS